MRYKLITNPFNCSACVFKSSKRQMWWSFFACDTGASKLVQGSCPLPGKGNGIFLKIVGFTTKCQDIKVIQWQPFKVLQPFWMESTLHIGFTSSTETFNFMFNKTYLLLRTRNNKISHVNSYFYFKLFEDNFGDW